MSAGLSSLTLFPTTQWTLLEVVAGRMAGDDVVALDRLLSSYLPAMKAHLMYTWRMTPERADDALQSFVADKVMAKRILHHVDRARTRRFRHFLRVALNRYVISLRRKERAQCRSPGEQALVSLEVTDEEALAVEVPRDTHAFDVIWAQSLIQETLRRLKIECEQSNRPHFYTVFDQRVIRPCLHDETIPPYDGTLSDHGFASSAQASNALLTAKRMFMRIFREVVREHANNQRGVEREIAELQQVLSNLRL